MPEPRDQLVEAVAKLTELTQTGRLKWSVDDDFQGPGIASPAYTATHKGRDLRLHKRRITEDNDSFIYRGSSSVRDQYVLEFVTSAGATLWSFPESGAIEDLFTAVQYQTAGVKSFLKDLLGEDW